MSRHRYHRGFRFEVWASSSAWFWRLIDPGRNGGTIGAAANEAEAVQEACATIEGIIGNIGGSASMLELDYRLLAAPLLIERQ